MTEPKTPPFPIFLDLAGADVLVVGDGDIAARRIEAVLRADARVKLAAAEPGPALAHLLDLPSVTPLDRGFEAGDIAGCRLIMVATDDDALNTEISAQAQAAGIPVNVADNLRLCTFIMPAIVDRAPITVAISSGGAAPVLSRRVKTAIEAAVPANIGRLAAYAGEVRPRVNADIGAGKARRRFWQNFADGPIATRYLNGDSAAADALVDAAISTLAAGRDIENNGEIIVLGTGEGDADLLSLRALQLMQRGDILLHDTGVPLAILDLARKDAERRPISNADAGWLDAMTLAKDGHSVLWMRSGAPQLPAGAKAAQADLETQGIAVTCIAAAR